MAVVLVPVSGKGLKFPVDKAILFIGRHPECDVVITRSRAISRKHCAIVQIDNCLVIRDLGSTNGVRVNGERVKKESRFTVGDTVTIGDLEYAVKLVRAPEPERRANRDHPQDARADGAIPLRVEPKAKADIQYSSEYPIAIPDEESFDSAEDDGDTPGSVPVVTNRRVAKKNDSDSLARDEGGRSDGDLDFPIAD